VNVPDAGLHALRLTALRAAAGEADITHCGTHGYRGAPLAESRIHDRLRARLLLLAGPEGEALWISADECTFRRGAAAIILAALERDAGIPAGRVLLAGNHIHSAHNYPSFLPEAFAAAVAPLAVALRDRLRPVAGLGLRLARTPPEAPIINRRLRIGSLGEHCVMFNDGCRVDGGRLDAAGQLAGEAARLGVDAAILGLPESGAWADGPVDDRLHLAVLRDAQGHAIASVARVNAHPVSASQSRVGPVISADFMRPLEDAVRARTGDAPCLVFNGAFGDARPLQREYSLAEAARIGQAWAAAMLAAPETVHPAPGLTLAGREESLPLRDDLPRDRAVLTALQRDIATRFAGLAGAQASPAMAAERKRLHERHAATATLLQPPPPEASGILLPGDLERGTAPLGLQAWRLGPFGLLATGGEPFTRLAAAIEARSGLLPIGVAGGYASYLLDPASCAGGGYEAGECLYAPATLARLPELAAALAAEMA
jgi:hypothetical protein